VRRRLGPAIVVLAALAAVGALGLTRADEVGEALERIPAWAIAAAVALHVAVLVLRSEAWRVTLAAAHGDTLSRRIVHGANAAGFVAGCFQSQAALPARVAALRRIAGQRAPRPGVIFVADVPIFALELWRVWLVLAVCGLPRGYAEVVGVFAALGIFGLLPIGPGAAPGATRGRARHGVRGRIGRGWPHAARDPRHARGGDRAGGSRSASSVDQPNPRAPSPCPDHGW
jgi:hypothetical protein